MLCFGRPDIDCEGARTMNELNCQALFRLSRPHSLAFLSRALSHLVSPPADHYIPKALTFVEHPQCGITPSLSPALGPGKCGSESETRETAHTGFLLHKTTQFEDTLFV